MSEISKDEYLAVQQTILIMAGQVRNLNLEGFLNAISRTHAAGHILDPTAYRHASGNLEIRRRKS